MATSAPRPSVKPQVGVYECAITLKLRILEESHVMADREHLLEQLIDAFSYGSDEFVEQLDAQVEVAEVAEIQASPLMRRQLIRLRNLPSA
ncbi:Npun_R1517 family heterocyst differentiation transcriptional regulator [Leptolyngbya sp. CCNP1308]|uniref:Npun_R1517 family heterocyst differentiation transcriptional regulator n=1 Tax=Leptolyngbya sp. CCNP1308 TaxID=3110255 RepID=UPI002B206C31|nr:Npun_R1517 family heterocyst differentiation transcriptional regulator [Leptolyngbya sp. CCNP1308]MEA5452213.1 Npun_R1517 family heterocyst differentiation transcriptional regulator [Leptolyngbya sp. CCNP1308]